LQAGYGRISDFHRKVAAGNHDRIGCIDDFVQHADGFGALDFCHQQAFSSSFVHQPARQFHVFCRAREGNRQIIRLDEGGSLDVFLVLVGQRGRSQAAALAVDPLVVGQNAAAHHFADHLRALDLDHVEFQHAVIQQQHGTLADIFGQILVVEADTLLVAEPGPFRVQDKRVTLLEHDLVVLDFAHTDLWALQVGQDPYNAAACSRCRAHFFHPGHMVLCGTVGKVHAHHIHAGLYHFFQHFLVAGGGSKGGNDLGSA